MKQLSFFEEIPPDESKKTKEPRSSMLGPASKPIGYQKYIQSHEWRKKAKVAKELAGNKCEQCGSTGPLEVHHLSYNNLYQEHFYNVKVLCAFCHRGADFLREDESRYTSYLHTKYGDDAALFDSEEEYARYEDWLERKTW